MSLPKEQDTKGDNHVGNVGRHEHNQHIYSERHIPHWRRDAGEMVKDRTYSCKFPINLPFLLRSCALTKALINFAYNANVFLRDRVRQRILLTYTTFSLYAYYGIIISCSLTVLLSSLSISLSLPEFTDWQDAIRICRKRYHICYANRQWY